MASSRPVVLLLVLLAACSSEDPVDPPIVPPPAGCVPGERPLEDGSCLPAGIAACGEGFELHPTEGCVATMPPEACPPGWMAVPGDTACREVAPCPSGRWGELPSEASIHYVDAAYTGTDSDGSEARPWPSLAGAITASPVSGIIALASGTYPAGYEVTKAVRIYGKCPAETTIVDDASSFAIAFTTVAATGSELHDVSVTSLGFGIGVAGPSDALLERVWIHDTGNTAVHVQNQFGPTRVTLRGVLIENVRAMGAYALGAALHIERSVIRDVIDQAPYGVGALVQSEPGVRGQLEISGSLIERTPVVGVSYQGADGRIADTLLRDNVLAQPQSAALGVADEPGVSGSQVVASGLVLERNGPRTIAVAGSTLTVEGTVVRDSLSRGDGTLGRGVSIEDSLVDGRRSSVTMTGSLVLRNREIGILAAGSDLLLESVAVRETSNNPAGVGGRGIGVQGNPMTGSGATATMRWSAISGSQQIALFISGQPVTVEDTLVSDTRSDATNAWGRSLEIRDDVVARVPGHLTLRRSRVEDSYEQGIFVFGGDLVAEDVTVVRTRANPTSGLFGDGIAVIASDESGVVIPASAAILRSRFEASDRAGVACFGAHVTLRDSIVDCSAFALASEVYLGTMPSLIDEGGNDCGCGDAREPCKITSASLAAPSPLDPTAP